jgi:hypothetical protein
MDIKEKNIENYYKNIDKPIINNFINNLNLKNLLNLTTIANLSVFTHTKIKNKNEWKLKDKRKLLKECEIKKKYKIKEATNILSSLVDNKSKILPVLTDIENIDELINTIEKEYPNVQNYLEIFSN